jgi:DNA-binding HxlR family transcriptional regulator
MTSDMIKTSSCVEECGIEHTLNMMGGKWKPFILWQLAKYGTKRYGEIRRYIPSVTNKMLSQQLKELAADCLVTRKDYRTVPPKVEYSITAEGLSLIPILELMCTWGLNHEALCRTKGKSDIGS